MLWDRYITDTGYAATLDAAAYTDQLRADLADQSDPLKGASLIGMLGKTLRAWILAHVPTNTPVTNGARGQYAIFQRDPTQAPAADMAARVYLVPKGRLPQGVQAAIKVFMDDYEQSDTSYRDFGLIADSNMGTDKFGAFLLNSRSRNAFFGIFPEIWHAFQDGAVAPMRAYYRNYDAPAFPGYKGDWAPGISVSIGDQRSSSVGKIYEATTAGTTGTTAPTWSSGTASDGGVSWQFLFDMAAAGGANFRSGMVIGRKTDNYYLNASTREAGLHLTRQALMYNGMALTFLANNGDVLWDWIPDANTRDVSFRSRTGGGRHRYSADSNYLQWDGLAEIDNVKSESSGATVVSVLGTRCLTFGNTTTTNVTQLTGLPFQRMEVASSNGQTTLINGANLDLGGSNITLGARPLLLRFNSSGTVARTYL